jgi:hypothetical protein
LYKGFVAMPAQVALITRFCFAVLYNMGFITNTSGTLKGQLLHYRHFKGVKNKPGNHTVARKIWCKI